MKTIARLSPLTFAAVMALGPTAANAATGDSLATATQKGANYLLPDVYSFSAGNACEACHRQGAALFGLSTALSAGYAVNTSATNGLNYLATHAANDQAANGRWVHEGSFYPLSKTSYAIFGLAGYDQYVSTARSTNLTRGADYLLTVQQANGRWVEDHGSLPTTYGDVPVTARMMVALRQAATRVDSTRAASYNAALTRAANYLRGIRASTDLAVMGRNYQIAYAILGLKAAGAANNDADVVYLQNRLFGALATGSVGWGYTVNTAADEFNTGLSLYALCQSGQRLTNNNLATHANWLNNRQVNTTVNGSPAGYWNSSAFAVRDVPTTFAMLGLGCFGTLGVTASVQGATSQMIPSASASSQVRTFTMRITNTSAFDGTDSYTLSTQGGMPGWTVATSAQVVTIASGSYSDVTITVTAPPQQPTSLPVTYSIVATSQSSASVSANVSVTVYTDPPPPVTGLATTVTLTSGNGITISNRLAAYTLAARVTYPTNVTVTGPGSGVVTFFVRGVPVGTDSDADGNGIYQLVWTPGISFSGTGTQDFRAIYSGIDRPTGNDLLSSFAAGTMILNLAADSDSDGIPNDIETGAAGTNPAVADTDGDGCLDGVEYYTMLTNPLVRDTDTDGVGDCVEQQQGTDPRNDDSFPDADQDGVSDGSDPFPCEGDRAAVLYVPAHRRYGTLMYENNWPNLGDLDFNDAVLAYNYAIYYNSDGLISSIVLTYDALAAGAFYDDGLALRLPTSVTSLASISRTINGGAAVSLSPTEGESNVVVTLTNNVRELFNNTTGFLNTDAALPTVNGSQVVVTVRFSTPVQLNIGDEPFDLFFFKVGEPGRQIHRPIYRGTDRMDTSLFNTGADMSDMSEGGRRFVNYMGMPYVLSMPVLVPWTTEETQISNLFPNIVGFASSGGVLNRNFYTTGVQLGAAFPGSNVTAEGVGNTAIIPNVTASRTCTSVPPGG